MNYILVTGGAGYVGSHTGWLLAQQGYKVVVLDRLVPAHFPHRWAEYICGDYGDATLIKGLCSRYSFTAVMHFGASTVVSESVYHPLAYYENNVAKTITFLDVLRQHNVNAFIFSSSCAVYGLPEYLPLTEEHPRSPISPYGRSKLMIEQVLHDCSESYDLRYVALRYFNAAGAQPREGLGEQHSPETHCIPLLLNSVHTGKPFSLYGADYPTKDGSCIRDYIHVRDIAAAHLQALVHLVDKKQPSDYFNIGTGSGYSVKELIATIEQVTQKKIPLIIAERRPGDPALLVADPSKAMTILQWKPYYSDLNTIVTSAWQYQQGLKK